MISDSFPLPTSLQDDLLEEDRLMLDRSPDEFCSGDDGDSDSDMDDGNETTVDGERVIYSWMRKGGIGE